MDSCNQSNDRVRETRTPAKWLHRSEYPKTRQEGSAQATSRHHQNDELESARRCPECVKLLVLGIKAGRESWVGTDDDGTPTGAGARSHYRAIIRERGIVIEVRRCGSSCTAGSIACLLIRMGWSETWTWRPTKRNSA
jgi:ssDNA-binding Zn-finger/Zn-ribbon topoisomerase 1